jgi:tRNA(fMet)-specific endonuclease VapC
MPALAQLAWMFDTNALSELIKSPQGSVARRLQGVAAGSVCTSVVVACELRFGAQRKASPVLQKRVEDLLSALPVLAFDGPADQHCADIRLGLERAGTPIGGMDLMIAAHARSLGLCVVTHNVREFNRVPGLLVEDWV